MNRSLVAVAVLGPILWTLSWLLTPLLYDGYDPVSETVSVLAAYGADYPQFVIGGLFAEGLAIAAMSVLAWWAGRRVISVLAAFSAVGTIVAAFARIACDSTNSAWCTVQPAGSYGTSELLHGVGASIGFVALAVAPLVAAIHEHGRTRVVDIAAGIVGLTALAAFQLTLSDIGGTRDIAGLVERLVLPVIDAWAAWFAVRCAARLNATASRQRP